MDFLVVGFLVRPAAENHSNPFESESAGGGRVMKSAAAHLVVVGASPCGVPDRKSSELMEGLPDEVGASCHRIS